MPFAQFFPRPLTPDAVCAYAPASPGVYGISNSHEWIYIADTDNIRDALLYLLQDVETSITERQPTGFVFEVCVRPSLSVRRDRLVREYEPACNLVSANQSSENAAVTAH